MAGIFNLATVQGFITLSKILWKNSYSPVYHLQYFIASLHLLTSYSTNHDMWFITRFYFIWTIHMTNQTTQTTGQEVKLSLSSATFYLASDWLRHYKKKFDSHGNLIRHNEYTIVKWGTTKLIQFLRSNMDQFDTWEKDRITEFVTKVNAMQNNQPTSSVDFVSILA